MTEHRASKATRRGRFSMRRLLIGLLAFAAAVGTTGGLALAYWTSSGSGTATATTGNLTAPQGVTGSSTAGTGTVSVSWTASTGTSAPRYYITRTDSSNVSSPACGTSSASTTNNTTCSDSTVPLGTYTYRVIAVYHNWTTPSAPSSAVTVARASQTITFTSTPGAPTLGGSYTVTATGGDSGNPVTFGTTTPAACTVSGSVVSFVHAGSCTVTADQAAST
ncbi:MAG: trimeric autotransporter adhesin, partial [Pseudonocardiales bacterium]|nr:trimeric autotransporter adhesin [Pseudonocardiales bacterium]